MAWTDVAYETMGGQAPAIINYLNQVDPNYDWSAALRQQNANLSAMYPDGGWADPNRGAAGEIASGLLSIAQGLDPTGHPGAGAKNQSYGQTAQNFHNEGVQQAAQIQQQQAQNGDDGFLGLGDFGTLLALGGGIYGLGALGGLWGAGAGAGAGAMDALGMEAMGSLGSWGSGAAGGGALGSGLGAAGGALPYGDAIEGLIDLTNKGMSGADAVAALGQINPAWTQTGIEFLMNNPSQLFGSGGDALKGLLGGAGGSSDLLGMLGKLGAAGLGAYASGEQSDALSKLAGQYQEYGAPSRARYEASMSPGFDPTSIPGYSGALDTASRGLLARLSTQGNPYGSPGGLIEANKQIVAGTALPAVQEYQRLNANTGFGNSMNAALNLQTGAIGEDANKYNALGYGLNQVTQPQTTFDSLIKSLRQSGLA